MNHARLPGESKRFDSSNSEISQSQSSAMLINEVKQHGVALNQIKTEDVNRNDKPTTVLLK